MCYWYIRVFRELVRRNLLLREQGLDSISRNPDSGKAGAVAAFELAGRCMHRGEFERANELLDRALAMGHSSAIIDITRAPLLFELGKYDEAWEAISRLQHGKWIAADTKAFVVLAGYASNHVEDAARMLQRLLIEHRWRGPDFAYRQAVQLEIIGKMEQANGIYREVTARRPRHTDALKGLVRTYTRLGDRDAALHVARRLGKICLDDDVRTFLAHLEERCTSKN